MAKLSSLASVSATRAVLEAHGLATKHALGQNFLVNDAILQKIVALAELNERDYVLEVGPGIGTLTIALLQTAGRVLSVERDTDLPAVLAETCAPWAHRFTLLNKDALELTAEDIAAGEVNEGEGANAGGFAEGAEPNKLVSNLPYAVAATVVLDFFERFSSLKSATVMVQKEVADRMCAQLGTKNYGAYTVKLRLHAEPAGRFPVGPSNFFPPPRVDSAVLRLNRRTLCGTDGAPLAPETLRAACIMADAAFASRRKTLANSCKTYFAGRGANGAGIVERLPELFERADISPAVRGETLSLEQFVALGEAYCALVRRV